MSYFTEEEIKETIRIKEEMNKLPDRGCGLYMLMFLVACIILSIKC